MAHLRTLRLELARNELGRAGEDGGSVASVALAHGFGRSAGSPPTTKPGSASSLPKRYAAARSDVELLGTATSTIAIWDGHFT
jgi:hypothetical protein